MSKTEEYTVKVNSYGTKYWHQNGLLNRLDRPAIEWANGDKYWYQNGLLHRLDGPAKEFAGGSKFYYIEGVQYSEEEFNQKIRELNNSCTGKIVIIDGKKYKLEEV